MKKTVITLVSMTVMSTLVFAVTLSANKLSVGDMVFELIEKSSSPELSICVNGTTRCIRFDPDIGDTKNTKDEKVFSSTESNCKILVKNLVGPKTTIAQYPGAQNNCNLSGANLIFTDYAFQDK